jgi:hypothetical protein
LAQAQQVVLVLHITEVQQEVIQSFRALLLMVVVVAVQAAAKHQQQAVPVAVAVLVAKQAQQVTSEDLRRQKVLLGVQLQQFLMQVQAVAVLAL